MGRSARRRGSGPRLVFVVRAAAATLTGAAVVQELRRPRHLRTWQGRVLGVPYDLRPPSPERLRSRLWDPTEPLLLVPSAFGVGWTVNLARVRDLLPSGRGGASGRR